MENTTVTELLRLMDNDMKNSIIDRLISLIKEMETSRDWASNILKENRETIKTDKCEIEELKKRLETTDKQFQELKCKYQIAMSQESSAKETIYDLKEQINALQESLESKCETIKHFTISCGIKDVIIDTREQEYIALKKILKDVYEIQDITFVGSMEEGFEARLAVYPVKE